MSNLSPLALTIAQTHAAGGWEAVAKLVAAWQPIETAPKDGTVVILYRPLAHITFDPHITIRKTTTSHRFVWPATIPNGRDGINYTEGSCYATHWRPMPEPPNVG